MNAWQKIKNFFKIGGAKVGMVQTLSNITDDPRINVPASEYDRINVNKRYYADDAKKITFKNSYGRARQRQMYTVGITRMAARRLASIIFNEQCKVTVDDEQANNVIEQVFKDNNFYENYENHLEKNIALGDGVIRPTIINSRIKFAWATADQVYPLEANTSEVNSIAIAFKSQHIENDKTIYYTLLEFHEWNKIDSTYLITYELYRSDSKDEVGVQVDLATLDEYANLPKQLKFENITSPLFAYYRNPGANNKNLDSPLGLGIPDVSRPTIDAINRTNDEFVEEVIKGRRRIAVSASMLTSMNNNRRHSEDTAHPPLFDEDETVFNPLYGDASDVGVKDLTTSIRTPEYTQAMDFFLHQFETEIGLSQGTFTTTPSGVQTATEVVSNNSMTYQTRSSYLTMVEKNIDDLVKAVLELAQSGTQFLDPQYQWDGDIDKVTINVDFNDGVFVDQTAQQQADLQAVTANALPIKEFLLRNYDLDETTADKWIEELQDEKSPTAPDMEEAFIGGDDSGDDDEEDDTQSDDEQGGQDS